VIAGIYRLVDCRDSQSDAVWVKVNGCRVACAQVSESEVENRRDICCGVRDAAPCTLPFHLSLPPSPPCAPLCVVCVRPSPPPLLPCLDSRAHLPPTGEGLGSRSYLYLAHSESIPSWMTQNHSTGIRRSEMDDGRDIQSDGECFGFGLFDGTNFFRTLVL